MSIKPTLEIEYMTIEQQFVLREILTNKSLSQIKYNFKLLDSFNLLTNNKDRKYDSTYRRMIKICNQMVGGKVLRRRYRYVSASKTKNGRMAIVYVYQINPNWRAENAVDLNDFKFRNYICQYAPLQQVKA